MYNDLFSFINKTEYVKVSHQADDVVYLYPDSYTHFQTLPLLLLQDLFTLSTPFIEQYTSFIKRKDQPGLGHMLH